MRFKSHIPLNKASTTCTKNDSCWLQSVCFSAYNFSSIPFNNSCLGTDLTKSRYMYQSLEENMEKKQKQEFTNVHTSHQLNFSHQKSFSTIFLEYKAVTEVCKLTLRIIHNDQHKTLVCCKINIHCLYAKQHNSTDRHIKDGESIPIKS